MLPIILLGLRSLTSIMKAGMKTNRTIFDFRAATHLPAWEVVNDGVMGGFSTSQFEVLTNNCGVFSGKVSLDNKGGFASVRSAPVREQLTGFTSFVLLVRGDGRGYKFTVRTGAGFDAPLYQCSFTTDPGAWEEHRLAFGDFVPTFRGWVLSDVPLLDPAKITSLGFIIADKQAGPFRLEVSWIKATLAQP